MRTSTICTKFGIPNMAQSSDTGQNTDGGISDFPISPQSLMNFFFHKSRTSDIYMKLGPVTNLEKKTKRTSKTFDHDVMSANCDVIVNFPNLWPIWLYWELESGPIVYKPYIFINSNLSSYKNCKTELKIL